jgi:DNA-binding transcriptional MocR family regulator
VAIADALARDVRAGRLLEGARLPTHRELARRLGVNVVPVTRGYAEAARRGLVEGTVGRGTFVREQGRRTEAFMPLRPEDGPLHDLGFNLTVSQPDLLDVPGTLRALAAAPERAPLVCGYTATGLAEHRAAGSAWLTRAGVDAAPERVLLCGGAQHAMTVAISSLTSPDDVILADEVTYPGLSALANVLHLRVVGVPGDAEGMLPGSLEDAAHQHNARVVYLMPNIHNPLGTIMPEGRRREVAEVAERRQIVLIEDDTYGFLLDEPPTPLAALAPARTYFLTSLSTSLTAGLRVGFLALPDRGPSQESVLRQVTANVASVAWAVAPLMGEIAAGWIRDGVADEQVAWKRAEVRARRQLLETELPALSSASAAESAHVWAALPAGWRAEEFCAAARERSVHLNPSSAFWTGRGRPPRAVRMCLGSPPRREQVVDALRRLAGVLSDGPAPETAALV